MKIKSIIAGITLTLAAGSAVASEGFSILEGIPTETIPSNEMKEVEGRFYYSPWTYLSVFQFLGGNSYFTSTSTYTSSSTSQRTVKIFVVKSQ